MGRQINFYFDKNDEQEFLKIHYFQNVIFLKFNVKKPANEIYDEFHLHPRYEASHSQTYICLKSGLKSVKYLEVKKHGFYFIDSQDSPVIEYTRSGYNDDSNILVSGRLWVEMKYWDKDKRGNSIYVSKSKELEELYNNLVKWIRKYCKRLPKGKYLGPHAMKLYEAGAELSP